MKKKVEQQICNIYIAKMCTSRMV